MALSSQQRDRLREALKGAAPTAVLRRLEGREGARLLLELLASVSVHKTDLFRDEAQLAALERDVLQPLALSRRPLQVWSAGCATGEEVATLLLLLARCGAHASSQVLGTDLSPSAIERARHLRFSSEAMRRVPPELASQFFKPVGALFELDRALATNARFLQHNLMDLPYPTSQAGGAFDLIVCRNVLIYLTQEAADEVVGRLAARLAPGGTLVLSTAEPILRARSDLETVRVEGAFFYRPRKTPLPALPSTPRASAPEPARHSWPFVPRASAPGAGASLVSGPPPRASEPAFVSPSPVPSGPGPRASTSFDEGLPMPRPSASIGEGTPMPPSSGPGPRATASIREGAPMTRPSGPEPRPSASNGQGTPMPPSSGPGPRATASIREGAPMPRPSGPGARPSASNGEGTPMPRPSGPGPRATESIGDGDPMTRASIGEGTQPSASAPAYATEPPRSAPGPVGAAERRPTFFEAPGEPPELEGERLFELVLQWSAEGQADVETEAGLRRALYLCPELPAARYCLGLILERRGARSDAQTEYRRALTVLDSGRSRPTPFFLNPARLTAACRQALSRLGG